MWYIRSKLLPMWNAKMTWPAHPTTSTNINLYMYMHVYLFAYLLLLITQRSTDLYQETVKRFTRSSLSPEMDQYLSSRNSSKTTTTSLKSRDSDHHTSCKLIYLRQKYFVGEQVLVVIFIILSNRLMLTYKISVYACMRKLKIFLFLHIHIVHMYLTIFIFCFYLFFTFFFCFLAFVIHCLSSLLFLCFALKVDLYLEATGRRRSSGKQFAY